MLRAARGILIPGPGMEPVPAAVETWSLNHWTTREAPRLSHLKHDSSMTLHTPPATTLVPSFLR